MSLPRRRFLSALGAIGALTALRRTAAAEEAPSAGASGADWDTAWIERVRRAKHRVVFDSREIGNALPLATRWLDSVKAVYGERPNEAVPVIVFRARAVAHALTDAAWAKYAVAEDAKVNDPTTGAPARRNVDWHAPDRPNANDEGLDLERLLGQRGAVVLVCNFALSHMAGRLAAKASAKTEDVHTELKTMLVPGAILAPSGIWGITAAQNAGAAYLPG